MVQNQNVYTSQPTDCFLEQKVKGQSRARSRSNHVSRQLKGLKYKYLKFTNLRTFQPVKCLGQSISRSRVLSKDQGHFKTLLFQQSVTLNFSQEDHIVELSKYSCSI